MPPGDAAFCPADLTTFCRLDDLGTGDRTTGRLLGMQLFGHKDAEIAKRVDIAAAAIFHGMTADAVSDLDLSYTPPLGSPWGAVQMAAQTWIRATASASKARPPADGLQNENARLQIYHCTGVSEQKYILVQANTGSAVIPGYFEIRPKSDPSMCLVPSSRSAFNGQPISDGQGAQVVQQTCFFYAQAQNWTFKSTNEIVNQYWGTCLDTTSNGTHDHEHVMIWPCNGNLAQRWLS